MTRRQWLGTAAAGLASRAQAATRPPNIVFVLTDDQRWDTLGCLGNPIIQTPHLDRLAPRSGLFTNHFVTTAICCVSRASIFTGLHERSHGCVDFETPLHAEDRPNAYYNLLRRAGYRTGFVGKYGVGSAMPEGDFDVWHGFPGQGRSEMRRNGQPVHITQVLTDHAVDFVDACRPGQPFCLSISTKAPHADDPEPRQYIPEPDLRSLYENVRIPYPPAFGEAAASSLPAFLRDAKTEMNVRFRKRFATQDSFQEMARNYYRLITGVDRMVGRVMASLEQRGLADNTILVYTSDNGYFLGERGMADKWLMYEPSIRVPLLVHDPRPGALRPGRREAMTLNLDFVPTMLDWAGIAPPPHLQGRSLLPLLRGRESRTRREWFYEHHYTRGVVIPPCEGVRTERWKYVRYLNAEPRYEQLFDLRRDPQEEQNRIDSDRRQADHLRGRWQAWTAALASWRRGQPWREPAPA